jgi:hypothetical protein
MENSYAKDIAVGVEKAVGVAILRRQQFYADGQFRGLPARGLRRRHRRLAVSIDAGRRHIASFP